MATRQQVARFLESFKRSIAEVGWLWVLNRERNRDGLIAVGITKKQREEVIRSLSPEDYCEGPLPDETQPGEVWVFGKHIEGTEVYIKLKLTNTEAPKCLSFHPAERTLHYPFRNRKMKEGRT
jgi:hypothetical protein